MFPAGRYHLISYEDNTIQLVVPGIDLRRWGVYRVVVALLSTAVALAVLYVLFRVVDPLPPSRLVIAAGMAGSGYENFAKHYARIFAQQGVELEIRNSAGAVENLELLRDPASGVQAALTTFGFTQPADVDTLYSLGGVLDAAIFVFTGTRSLFRFLLSFGGKRLSIGVPGSALRALTLEVLKATDALDASTRLVDDLDYKHGTRCINCR